LAAQENVSVLPTSILPTGNSDAQVNGTATDPLNFFPTSYAQMQGTGYDYDLSSTSVPDTKPSDPFQDEPPLLEELGINPSHIWMKTVSVLHPLSRKKLDAHIIGDRDLAGPFLFCAALAVLLALSGKFHFGYVFGFGSFSCLAIYIVLNLMSESGVDLYKTTSVLGYCLLPMVTLAVFAVFASMNSILGYIFAVLCILWCTYSAVSMFVALLSLHDQRLLVAYPVALVYASFALMTVF